MDSGTRIAAGGRTLAEAAAVVASPGRAAVLLLRAAIAGTYGLDGALSRLATVLAGPGDLDVAGDRVDIEVELRWQLAADAVLGVNVDGRLLRAAVDGAGGIGAVPPPVVLAGCTQPGALDACRSWLREAARVRLALAAARAERAEQLRADVPLPASVLAWLRRSSGKHAGDPATGPRPRTGPDSEVAYWLDRVHPDADGEQLAEIAGLARRAVTEAPALPQLTDLVRTTGDRLARRRRQASTAAALLEGLAGTPGPVDPALVHALDQVVTGRLPEIPDGVRAAALVELVEAEHAAGSPEPAQRTEWGQQRESPPLSPVPG